MSTNFYDPKPRDLEILNEHTWVCSYSGGKDSTSVVSWIEWLRRRGDVKHPQPRLVLSDTGVEYPFLEEITQEMLSLLRSYGWHCEVVRPRLQDRLYNQIFGRGVTPVSPAARKLMRWCTRATKVSPMNAWVGTLDEHTVQISGVRYGESQSRDEKLRRHELKVASCSAGGECGLPSPGHTVRELHSPIIDWKVCQVMDWLQGLVSKDVRSLLEDVYPLTTRLVHAYGMKVRPPGFGAAPPEVTALRFGCIGCPAVDKSKVLDHHRGEGGFDHLRGLYRLWVRARLVKNRCVKDRKPGGKHRSKSARMAGPLKMQFRKELYAEFLEIQRLSGVQLVTPADDAFIRQCWEDNVYPKGWGPEHEKG